MTSACELWTGATYASGYGQHGGRGAHRVAYEQTHGTIPVGMLVRHTCDVKLCVNPEHLLLGTHADNSRDKVSRMRQARGVTANKSSLTDADILAIRGSTEHQIILSSRFGVSQAMISRIKSCKSWKHVP